MKIRREDVKVRKTWGETNPVTKIEQPKKRYRRKARSKRRDADFDPWYGE